MIANNSKHVVLAAWQALATRDPQRIAAMFTEDAEWRRRTEMRRRSH